MPRNPPTPDHRPRGAHLASEQRWTGEALGALLAASSPGLTARVSTSRTAVDYLDTQDWALLRAGQVLERIAGAVDVELVKAKTQYDLHDGQNSKDRSHGFISRGSSRWLGLAFESALKMESIRPGFCLSHCCSMALICWR